MFNGFINLFGGLFAGLSGGILCDWFASRNKMGPAIVCVGGCLIGLPLLCGAVLINDNFKLSMFLLGMKVFLSENWFSPSITLIQNSVRSDKFGNMLTSGKFFGRMVSAVVTSIFGFIVGHYGLLNNPVILGRLIAF